jgi:hypothetical protein
MSKEHTMTDEAKKENTKEESGQAEKPIEKMTAKELREIAKEIPGVTGVHVMKKDKLLTLIRESRGEEEKAPAREEREKKAKQKKGALGVKDIKQKIAGLKEEKKKAREAGDKDKIESLRRRINRLKKQSRKAAGT